MTGTLERCEMFIDGSWRAASDGRTEPILNPATEEAIAEVPMGSAADVDLAVRAARAAFDGAWSATTPAERSRLLYRLADRIEAGAEELSRIEARNVGKPLPVAADDVEFAVDNLRFFAGAARVLEGRAAGEYLRGATSMIRREPLGVVASIAPWNYPLLMMAWKIGPALAAGNTVVLKPSEITPLSALRVLALAADLFPPGVLNVVTGHGPPVGAGLVAHPGVDMVSLTGEVGTGREVMRGAAGTLKRVHLELGGKAPLVVLDDVDIDAAARGIRRSAFYNSGQDCTAACRILVHARVHDALLARLLPLVESIRLGDPLGGADIDAGPLASRAQLDRVSGMVDRAREAGARILLGGERVGGRGFFYRPTVVADVRQGDEIVQREVFGPVITVQRVEDDAQALEWANDVPYALTASVWTRDAARALSFARRLRFGTVWINDHTRLTPEMPHGGFKQSGSGKDMSMYALEEYTQIKHVMARF
jgi:aminobutyraldehyde dehydrogenase